MFGVISSAVFITDILKSFEQEPIYNKFGKMTEEDFMKYCLEASRVSIQLLIVDMDSTEHEASIVRGIRQYKLLRPQTRIILLAVDRKPGNQSISDLVGLGIYDIVAPAIPIEDEEEINEQDTNFDVIPFIVNQLRKNSTYADVARWHYMSEDFELQAEAQQQTKTRVIKNVIGERIIERNITQKEYQAIPSKVVIVGSLYPGAGSTILATNLARMIAKRHIDVTYIEHPLIQPYMFDYLQIHADENTQYFDVASEINVDGIARSKKDPWIKFDIRWQVIDSTKEPITSFSYQNLMALSHAVATNVLIIDISNRWLDPEIQKFLYLADTILMCVEPDPIKYDRSLYENKGFKPNERLIMDFLNNDKELEHFDIVLMKNVEKIDTRLVKEMLHKKPIASLPFVQYQTIQKALLKKKLLYDFQDNHEIFEQTLIPIIKKFVPKDFVQLKPKGKSFFSSLWNMLKK